MRGGIQWQFIAASNTLWHPTHQPYGAVYHGDLQLLTAGWYQYGRSIPIDNIPACDNTDRSMFNQQDSISL